MAGLDLLIRLAHRETEQRQLHLAEISRARNQAIAALTAQQDLFAAESRVAARDLEALEAFTVWRPAAMRQEATLRQRSNDLAHTEQEALDRLRESFIDTKRLELVQQAALNATRLVSQRRADASADERERMRYALLVT
jgi:hypothetical protein